MILHGRLLEVLDYESSTGLFRWKLRTSGPDRRGKVAGAVTHNGYIQVWVDGRAYLGHRLAWFYVHGVWPKRIDHKDQNKKHNAIDNLRDVTQSQNMANVGKRASNTTGFKGVSWHKQARKYVARIRLNYRYIYLGLFTRPEDAHAVYCAKAKELFGEFAA